jgi:plastocyanin
VNSGAFKISILWALFAVAASGTYLLSERIQSGGSSAAAVFFASGSSREIDLYAGKADPSAVEVRPGDQVVFVVKDDSRHDIAEERTGRRDARLESGEIGKDESYSLVFDGPGAFSFYDRLDQDIRVAVAVK